MFTKLFKVNVNIDTYIENNNKTHILVIHYYRLYINVKKKFLNIREKNYIR